MRLTFLRYWLPLIAYMLLIVVVSSLEMPPTPEVDWEHIDKVYHLLEYAVLGFLAFRAFRWQLFQKWESSALVVLVTMLFCVAFGITDEIHQRFVEMREASIADLGADSLGAAIGIGFALIGRRMWGKRK